MRLFVAADVDDRTRAQVAQARGAMQRVLDRARVPPRVTWVSPDAVHVTLRFIGEVSDTTMPLLKQVLQAPFDVQPFDVCWDRLGTFPGGGHPRVVWVGSGSGEKPLQSLATAVGDRVARLVGPPDSRPFKAHLTLGRVKEPGHGVDWPAVIAAAPFKPSITRVDHVTLYLSQTSPNGPTYTALSTTPLRVER